VVQPPSQFLVDEAVMPPQAVNLQLKVGDVGKQTPQVGPGDRAVVRGVHPAVERRARHGQHLRGREDENDRPAPHA
jgi:hypothetical protein